MESEKDNEIFSLRLQNRTLIELNKILTKDISELNDTISELKDKLADMKQQLLFAGIQVPRQNSEQQDSRRSPN